MTIASTTRWLTGTVTQKLLRMADGAMLGRPMATFAGGVNPTTHGGAHGVVGTDDLKVTISSGLTLAVAAGAGFINGTSSVDQGVYYVANPTATTIALSAHSASIRYDAVIVRARDNAEDGSGSTGLLLDKVTGTAGAPVGSLTIPSGSLVLATVQVPATSGAVVITDTRPYVAAVGGVVRCKSSLRPTAAALADGLHIFETDTGLRWHWRQTGSTPTVGSWVRDTPRTIIGGTETNGSAGGTLTAQQANEAKTTDASGYFAVTYSTAFIGLVPIPQISVGSESPGSIQIVLLSTSLTGFIAKVFQTSTGSAWTSSNVVCAWQAIGYTA